MSDSDLLSGDNVRIGFTLSLNVVRMTELLFTSVIESSSLIWQLRSCIVVLPLLVFMNIISSLLLVNL